MDRLTEIQAYKHTHIENDVFIHRFILYKNIFYKVFCNQRSEPKIISDVLTRDLEEHT